MFFTCHHVTILYYSNIQSSTAGSPQTVYNPCFLTQTSFHCPASQSQQSCWPGFYFQIPPSTPPPPNVWLSGSFSVFLLMALEFLLFQRGEAEAGLLLHNFPVWGFTAKIWTVNFPTKLYFLHLEEQDPGAQTA